MEARTKIIAAVAVIMMCAAGLVGAGYAYTASTENSGNTVTSEYIVMTQSGPGAYSFAPTAGTPAENLRVYYDTMNYTNNTTFKYRLSDTRVGLNTDGVAGDDYVATKLGETIYLNVDDQGRTPGDLACTFETDGFVFNDPYTLILKITSGTDPAVYKIMTDDDTWNNNAFIIDYDEAGTDYKDLTVEVYYGYLITATVEDTAAGWILNTAPADEPINNAKITFSATLAGNNQLTLDKALIEVNTGAAAQVITAKLFGFKGENGTIAGDIVWTVAPASGVVTVAGSGDNDTTGTVTIVGAGTATITATFTYGGVDYTATCEVIVTATPAP